MSASDAKSSCPAAAPTGATAAGAATLTSIDPEGAAPGDIRAFDLNTGEVRYTPPDGIPALKQAIIRYTEDFYGWRPQPENVMAAGGAKQAVEGLGYLEIGMNRRRLSRLGISVAAVRSLIETAIGGQVVTIFHSKVRAGGVEPAVPSSAGLPQAATPAAAAAPAKKSRLFMELLSSPRLAVPLEPTLAAHTAAR